MTLPTSLYQTILEHEVFLATGCTEPTACAYAAALAAGLLGEPAERIELAVDPGTYKNGAGVVVPYTGGATGNLIAAAAGAMIADGSDKLQVLRRTTPEILAQAKRMLEEGRATLSCLEGIGFRVEASVFGAGHRARCILADGHAHIAALERDGVALSIPGSTSGDGSLDYRDTLRQATFAELWQMADALPASVLAPLEEQLRVNQEMAGLGEPLGRSGCQLELMRRKGYLADDLFFRTKVAVAKAVDARMAGVNHPVYTSGGSGNQGLMVSLTLHTVAQNMGVPRERLLRSLALGHLVNAYVKAHLGELSAVCGCATGAGIANAVAIVYQQGPYDPAKILLAVNNVIGDLGGVICDGAKASCALKAITAVDCALRAALMALDNNGLTGENGVMAYTPEEAVRNLCRVALDGMPFVDPTVIRIIHERDLHKANPCRL